MGANYWRLWTASVVSNLGDGVATVAYPWLASSLTRSPIHLAGVAMASRIPWLLFSLPAGAVTDRVDRRRLIVAMDSFRFVVTLVVAITVGLRQGVLPEPTALAAGLVGPPPGRTVLLTMLYVAAFVLGSAEVLRDNTAQTLMPSVVAAGDLEKANGRLEGAELVLNSFIGPPLAGVLIAVGLAVPFHLDAVSFALSALLVSLMTGVYRARGRQGGAVTSGATQAGVSGLLGEIREGVSWLWHHDLLRALAVILGLLNLSLAMATATFVLFGQEILGLSASGFGLLLTSGAVGGVLGSLVASRVSTALGSGRALAVAVAFTFGQLLVTGLTSSAVVAWLAFFVGSVWGVVWNVITVSFRQQIIPDRLLGRVNSVYRLLAWGTIPLGALGGGLIVALVEGPRGREAGLRAPFLVAAGINVVLFVLALRHLGTAKIESARAEARRTP
ncbi:MAG TPA: MFS transporter [Acidimicrobiales bacterium]|nr:MFS transporter [Acidimicrobiales bacterium]